MVFSFLQTKTVESLKRLLDDGLRRLTFRDNFFSSVRTVTVEAGQEITVSHDLKNVPKYYILGSQDTEGQIVIGDRAWTNSTISIKNLSINTITATIIILG